MYIKIYNDGNHHESIYIQNKKEFIVLYRKISKGCLGWQQGFNEAFINTEKGDIWFVLPYYSSKNFQ